MNANVLEKQFDDLTAIKGIGRARQAWLRQALNIATFADLVALSADEIAAALKADQRLVAYDLIEDWLVEANRLVGETAVSPIKQSRFETWQPFASFVVEFQERKLAGQTKEQRTKVHYMETDAETLWPGLAHEALSDWIREQVGETEEVDPPPTEVLPVAQPSPAVAPLQLEVERLVVWQPIQSATPQLVYEAERPLTGYLQANIPFSARLTLAFPSAPASELELVADLHARNLSTGLNMPLSLAVTPVKVGEPKVTAVLDEGALPAGIYRFVLLFKQLRPLSVQFIELPRFQVV